jgi:hypothetical protein
MGKTPSEAPGAVVQPGMEPDGARSERRGGWFDDELDDAAK